MEAARTGVVADVGASGQEPAALLLVDDDRQRQGILLDLPHVVEDSAGVLAAAGLTDRVQVVGGDFFARGPAADHYVLSTVLHDRDDEACEQILRNIADVGPTTATLTLAETVVPEGDEWHPAKTSHLVMLGMLSGRERTQGAR